MNHWQMFFCGVAVGAGLVGLAVIVLVVVNGIRARREEPEEPEVVRARGLEVVR